MVKFQRTLQVLGILAVLSLLGALPAAAQTTVEVTASWTPPTEGSPVDHYILQLSTDGGPFSTVASVSGTSYVLDLEIGHTYIARVAGVDAQDRQGPWSVSSDPYSPDLGPPGQPGKPIVM
ncbi:MAG TPA: fibronectin type III domain-containing protein [Candidatus Krumholzibacteria bacterium]|nr:fibronectin type III domain-containing protein [Candidatus Krumholzibacteria bacterium]HPD72887.1 fibronectin type III domain-containing protein [Candidatus Krumholzibacteria bacterium]HRY41686.1 fibronectin type III domain-containing protein [Candidatus Krumholzibacteria bacterium]